jgi:ribosomal protein S18 acetylase RimI-like enzyme
MWGFMPFWGGYMMRSLVSCRFILEETVPGPRPLTWFEGMKEFATGVQSEVLDNQQDHKKVVGIVYYNLLSGKIHWLAVSEAHKGRGLGTLLLSAAIEHIKTGEVVGEGSHTSSVSLTVCRKDLERTPGLISFYQVCLLTHAHARALRR